MLVSGHKWRNLEMGKRKSTEYKDGDCKGAIIFFGRVPNFPKVSVNKTAILYFGNKNFMTPHHRYTLPPKQAKIVLKSVSLNKINILSVVIL